MTFLRPVDRRLRYGLSVAGLFLFLFCFCTGCGAKQKTTLSEENVIRETGESTVESVTWSERWRMPRCFKLTPIPRDIV